MQIRKKMPAAAAIVSSIVLSGALVGCSESDNPEATAGDAPQSTKQSSASGQSSTSGKSIPSDFPKSVPLPKSATLSSVNKVSDVGWRLMFAIPATSDNPIDEYAQQFKDAGFATEIDDSTGKNIHAQSDEFEIDVVVSPPVVTLQVLKKD